MNKWNDKKSKTGVEQDKEKSQCRKAPAETIDMDKMESQVVSDSVIISFPSFNFWLNKGRLLDPIRKIGQLSISVSAWLASGELKSSVSRL